MVARAQVQRQIFEALALMREPGQAQDRCCRTSGVIPAAVQAEAILRQPPVRLKFGLAARSNLSNLRSYPSLRRETLAFGLQQSSAFRRPAEVASQ